MTSTKERRIVLLGKTGSGKSSLANTILGGPLCKEDSSSKSGTKTSQVETREVSGRLVTVIDTPGFFDTDSSEESLKPEIVKCIVESAEGPHAFLIVFKVEKFTEQEQAVVDEVCKYFSEEVLKYTCIAFTRGDELDEEKKIEDFVAPNKKLSDLVKNCGGGCHVFDNKHWKNEEKNNYRSNKFQVRKLLDSIDKMVERNRLGCYTNKMLQEVDKRTKSEEELITQSSLNMSEEEIRIQAKVNVSAALEKELETFPSQKLFAAFFGLSAAVLAAAAIVKSNKAVEGTAAAAAAAAAAADKVVEVIKGAAVTETITNVFKLS